MLKKIKNILEGWKNYYLGTSPEQEALFRDRLRICQSNECERLKLGICTECGCPVKKKTKALDEDCPLNMWRPILYEENGVGFFILDELPDETFTEFIKWAFSDSEPRDLVVLEDSKTTAFTWQVWQDFKDYLRTSS